MSRVTPEIAHLIFESSGDCLWMMDTAGRHLYVNEAVERILGYNSEEFLALTSMTSLIHPDDEARAAQFLEQVMERRTSWSGEVFRWAAKDGSYRWLESNGSPVFDQDAHLIGFCGADRDITPRLEQERRVAESERLFRATFEHAGVGIAHFSTGRRWLRVNQPLCAMLGYSERELLELDFRDVTHAEDLDADSDMARRLLAGEIPSYTIEQRYVRKDGSLVWAASTSTLVRDVAGNAEYGIAVIRDVSERKQAEAALRRSEEEYRALFETSNDALLVIDPTTAKIVEANRRAASIYARPHDELVGTSISELTHDLGTGQDSARALLAGAPFVRFEATHRKGDGTNVELEVTLSIMQYGGRTAILNTNRDVTERNRLVHELERSELRFRSIVEHGYDLIVVMDRNGISRYVAGAIGPNLGYTPEELQGTDILALLHPDERDEVRELLGVIADAQEQTRATRNMRVRHRSGAYRWHEVTSVNMLAVSGVEGIVVIAHDVTEQLELAQRLEQERRIDSLGRVAAIVAHEVNNALMSIAPIAEILARKYVADPDIPRLARQITAGVQRGKRVTQQILRFSKPAQPSRMPVVVGDWLAAIEPELNALAGARVRVTTFCTDPLLTIYVDPDQLHQVITNLTVNARDAMQGGGAIDVFAIEAEPGVVEISVHDHGPGIPADVMARVFEPLFTTKANGTGIGLPLSQQIAAAHGGSLSIDSEVGVGTVARVQLPVYRVRPPQLSYAT